MIRCCLILSALLLPACVPQGGEFPIEPIVGDDDDGPVPGPTCTLRDLDDAELPTAVEGAEYSGRALVEGYDGDVVFSLAQGVLPAGITMASNGEVSGTPTELGTFDLWLRATGMTISDGFGCLQLIVSDLPSDAFLGYVHDQRTFLTDNEGVQQDLWVRIAGGGEEGQDENLLVPAVFTPGPDGVNDQGGSDDVLVRLIDPGDVLVEAGLWTNGDGEPELDPATHEGAGLFVAGLDTGTLPFTMTHPEFDPVESILQVVPPDWCPDGLSTGPGDGSCQ